MTELADFLEARIAETEAAVRVWSSADAIWTPHVLAECEAKRRIVDAYRKALTVYEMPAVRTDHRLYQRAACEARALPAVLAALATPYAKHPDYREEWRL